MRIAQVAPLFEAVPPLLYGGTERVVSYLTEELVALGHDVTLFASGDSVTRARLVPACERSLRLDPDCIDPLPHHLVLLEQVMRHRNDFDVIHFHVDFLHYPLSRRMTTPQLTTLHGRLDIPDLVPLYREYSDMPLVSISKAQQGPLPGSHWLGTVLHGLPPDLLLPQPEREGYLAFLGRVSPEKGLLNAIEIATRAGLPLKIAAKVDAADERFFEREVVPRLAHPLVEFVGEVGEADKARFLGRARALLFPIDWPEPFGLVMIEAMATGTPVIAFERGSVSEILEHGVTAFLVEDVEDAVSAVQRVDEIDRARCRGEFLRRFAARRMAEDYVSVYMQLLSPQGRGLAAA